MPMTKAAHGAAMVHALLALYTYVVFGVLAGGGLPVVALLLLVTWPFDKNRVVAGHAVRLITATIGRACPLWRLEIEGTERRPRGSFVVVANHESILDIFLLTRLPWEMKWVAKLSLFKAPLVGQYLRLRGDVPVDRSSKESGSAAMQKVDRYLERKMPVMFFPEGTRSTTDQLRPFKLGAFVSAIRAGCPILPVAVHGARGGMPKGSPWIRRTVARARVLSPIPTAGLQIADAAALAEQARAQILEARDALARLDVPTSAPAKLPVEA